MPPSPDCEPPIAVTVPANVVEPTDQIETVPPFPLVCASAWMVALAATVVFCADAYGPLPCNPPPTLTVPPPASPEASITAPSATVTEFPASATVPPVSPAPLPVALIVPLS